jgi:hypothetical protein
MYVPPPAAWPVPPPRPPRKSNAGLILLICGSVLFLLLILTTVLALGYPKPQQDNRAHDWGYNHLGSGAASLADAGMSPGAACRFEVQMEASLGYIDFGGQEPSWWDATAVQQGCLDYVHQTKPGVEP